jgi:hypothetical protein
VENFPAVDDHLVEPESGMEVFRGEVRRAMAGDPPHALEQCNIASVIHLDVAPGYVASTELLTRVDHDSNFATDACIRKDGHDPATGSRYLEEISFEVKHTQSDKDLTERARMLVRRGVRRVFAVKVREDEEGAVEAGPVKEWLAAEDRWVELDPESEIVDRCLKHPIKVKALIEVPEARAQVLRGFVADDHPLLVEDRQKAVAAREQELVAAHAGELAAREQELVAAHAGELAAREQELVAAHAGELAAREQELVAAHAGELAAREQELVAAHARELAARDEQERLRLQAMIVDFCDLLAIELTAERRARMEAMTGTELDTLCDAIRTGRRWPAK